MLSNYQRTDLFNKMHFRVYVTVDTFDEHKIFVENTILKTDQCQFAETLLILHVFKRETGKFKLQLSAL